MAHDFNSIRISGNLLSNEFVYTSTQPRSKLEAFAPNTFDPNWKDEGDFEEGLAEAWTIAKDRYDAVHDELARMDTSQTRERWMLPLLRTLGFSPQYQASKIQIPNSSLAYQISHRGWDGPGAPAIHVLTPQDDLDTKPPERGAKSPQAHVQSYLNQDTSQQWAILSNGVVLRLLRDYFHASQPGYVEYNLVQMFETRDVDEFRSLFRLAHASRFIPSNLDVSLADVEQSDAESFEEISDEDADEQETVAEEPVTPKIWLEVCYDLSRATGTRAETSLRTNVTRALEVLGNGLLTQDLREALEGDHAEIGEYYRQLLRVIYRCIFLLFAEQRGLVPSADGDTGEYADVYSNEYSLTALRDLAEERTTVGDDGRDLWERLLVTFQLAHSGNEELGVPGFNGALFEPGRTALLTGHTTDLAKRNESSDLPSLSNTEVLDFIEHLAFTDLDGVGRERINYRDLEVEEIGHIYESLLDYAPRIADRDLELDGRLVPRGMFFLDDRGLERKSTGSYYTPRSLVQEIIGRALLPVVEERLENAGDDATAKEQALLGIRVLDPACGSAAFLIAANNALAKQLADIRWDAGTQTRQRKRVEDFHLQGTTAFFATEGGPSRHTYEAELNRARRDVLSHCIYGVDLNDMAVELAKVALWINAAERDKPLSFLDHRIKHGNSLVGAPLNFLQLGIDPDAFKGRGDEDNERLLEIRRVFAPKDSREYRKNPPPLFDLDIRVPDLDSLEENEAADVTEKANRYRMFREREDFQKWQLIANYWTSAFFYPVKNDIGHIPNQQGLSMLWQSRETYSIEQLRDLRGDDHTWQRIRDLTDEYRFFHYWLEFPEAFFELDGSLKPGGGFDVIVGNPPWERVKLQEKEFFATRNEEIANASTAAKRKKLIRELEDEDPALYAEFQHAIVQADATSNFLRVSGRYPLGGVGDVNTYQVFTENARDLTSDRGRTGIIVPSGIATDHTTKDLFRDFVDSKSLVSLDDFENRKAIFPGVHRSYKFCVLILTAPGSGPDAPEFSFFNTQVEHLNDLRRKFQLSPEDFRLINPNTLTCPTFRTGRDAEITLKMYRKAGVFIDENDPENGNPWGASFFAMFHMTNDSGLFNDSSEIEAEGYSLVGNRYVLEDDTYMPLYEAKLFHQFNHRFATYTDETNTRVATTSELKNPSWVPQPKTWLHESEVRKSVHSSFETLPETPEWLVAFRDITNTTNERTVIFSVIPFSAVANNAPCVLFDRDPLAVSAFLACTSSLVFDYVARQKLGGTHLNYYLLKQLPVPSPDQFSKARLTPLVARVLELVYTSWDVKPFADAVWGASTDELKELIKKRSNFMSDSAKAWNSGEVGIPLAPYEWNEARRRILRAEIDADLAHLYQVTRDELVWILDPRDVDPHTPSRTFSGLRRNDEKNHGEFITRKLVLNAFDSLAGHRASDSVKAREST